MRSTTEIELAFDCSRSFALPQLDGLATISERDLRLTAHYWDTDDNRLLSWGATLRHRSASDGSEDGWTLKLGTRQHRDKPSVRDEISEPGLPDEPPAPLLDLVRAMTLDRPLVPIASIVTDRHITAVGTESGPTAVEIADDDVSSRVADAVGPSFRQIEVELIDPRQFDLLVTVSRKLRKAGLRPSEQASKIGRVVGLPDASRAAAYASLDDDSTVTDVARALIGRATSPLIRNDPGVRLGDDVEAVHRARVATRRLRANLRLLQPVLDRDEVASIRADLRWFGGLLGELRDSQVLTQRLEADVRDRDGETREGGAELVSRLHDRSEHQRRQLLSAMSGERYIRLLERLLRFEEEPPVRRDADLDRPTLPIMKRQARRAWRQARHRVKILGPTPTDAELHEVRKAVKKVRYIAEATGRVAADSKKFVRRATALQDELGELHDCVVKMAWLADDADRHNARAAFLAGQLHEQAKERRRALRMTWRDEWDELDRPRLLRWME